MGFNEVRAKLDELRKRVDQIRERYSELVRVIDARRRSSGGVNTSIVAFMHFVGHVIRDAYASLGIASYGDMLNATASFVGANNVENAFTYVAVGIIEDVERKLRIVELALNQVEKQLERER